jgi:hypothetical protein
MQAMALLQMIHVGFDDSPGGKFRDFMAQVRLNML